MSKTAFILMSVLILSSQSSAATQANLNQFIWPQLTQAIRNKHAEVFTVQIASNPICGEMDPDFMGDACGYEAIRVDNSGTVGDDKIIIYFHNYLLDHLKVGDQVDVWALQYAHFQYVVHPALPEPEPEDTTLQPEEI